MATRYVEGVGGPLWSRAWSHSPPWHSPIPQYDVFAEAEYRNLYTALEEARSLTSPSMADVKELYNTYKQRGGALDFTEFEAEIEGAAAQHAAVRPAAPRLIAAAYTFCHSLSFHAQLPLARFREKTRTAQIRCCLPPWAYLRFPLSRSSLSSSWMIRPPTWPGRGSLRRLFKKLAGT